MADASTVPAAFPVLLAALTRSLRPEVGDRLVLIFFLTLSPLCLFSYSLYLCRYCNDRGGTRQQGTPIHLQMHVSIYSSSGLY